MAIEFNFRSIKTFPYHQPTKASSVGDPRSFKTQNGTSEWFICVEQCQDVEVEV